MRVILPCKIDIVSGCRYHYERANRLERSLTLSLIGDVIINARSEIEKDHEEGSNESHHDKQNCECQPGADKTYDCVHSVPPESLINLTGIIDRRE
jgi:hypothetical protein